MADREKALDAASTQTPQANGPDNGIIKEPAFTVEAGGDLATVVNETTTKPLDRLILVPQVTDPRAYKRSWKWSITVLVSAAAAIDSISSNVFYPSLPQIPSSLSTSPTVANLAIAIPIASTAILPLYWSSASEQYGRRETYVVSLILCVVLNVLCALSSSIVMLVITRTLAAGAGCAVTPIGAAVVADIWEITEKGQAMSIYFVGILAGPVLGPVLGGLLTQRWSWRGTQWFMMAYSSLILLLILFGLPNTLRGAAEPSSATQNPRLGYKSSRAKVTAWLLRAGSAALSPFRILYFLLCPAIALIIYLASITFLVVKALQISIQQSFATSPYNFTPSILGLAFLPFSIGLILGDLVGGQWSDHVMHRTAVSRNGQEEGSEPTHTPEDRLQENAWVAIILFPAGLLWYGWSIDKGVFWVVPMLGLVAVGLSSGLLFSLVFTVLVELLPARSASLVALDGLGENAFAAIGSVIAQPILAAIGNGWVFTIVAIVTGANVLVILLMKKYGQRWREKLG
ncbi:hypothetical protein MMC26_001783 [Xylographa opegraphella]|nr:hypothetical protein [Xylographa opegraphella]